MRQCLGLKGRPRLFAVVSLFDQHPSPRCTLDMSRVQRFIPGGVFPRTGAARRSTARQLTAVYLAGTDGWLFGSAQRPIDSGGEKSTRLPHRSFLILTSSL